MKGIAVLAAAAGLFAAAPASVIAADHEVVLFDAATADMAGITALNGAELNLADGELRVSVKPPKKYTGFAVKGRWNVSGCGRVEVEFTDGGLKGNYTLRLLNPGGSRANGGCYIANLPAEGERRITLGSQFPPHLPEWEKILAKLTRVRTWALQYLVWNHEPMRPGRPWRRRLDGAQVSTLDPSNVVEAAVYIESPRQAHSWCVKRIVAKGPPIEVDRDSMPDFAKKTVETFFPCIDEYGQFKHREWLNKVHSDADLAMQREKEEKDLAAHPGPSGWDKWGGWADGPVFEDRKGGFSTIKWKGKWWIVDPDGHLWWSHGPVRVSPSCATCALDGHEDWFERLPAKDEPEAEFYSTRDKLLFPYYARRGMHKIYDFSAQNIARKYGKDWYAVWSDLAHRRLRSWGCNTIANSSDKTICLMDRTPYTERYEIRSRPIAGHSGGWWDFCDPFDPSFRAEARRMNEIHREQIDDPWCFGFFVDNEHWWGEPHSLGCSTLRSPPDQVCKRVFRDRMQSKYGTIEKLNAQWNTSYVDWGAFLSVTSMPVNIEGMRPDLEAFSEEIADNYYRIVREEFKRVSPNKLYLGCRWAGVEHVPEFSVRVAARYCDVLSYNIYSCSLRDFKLPEGLDKPVIIGEFHFGAIDRGPFAPGIILLKDQASRARTYEDYVRSALEHPSIVGVHWHQFSDQAAAGRFDGENMQVGWTDICDTPYQETIEAVRKVGGELYRIRAGVQE